MFVLSMCARMLHAQAQVKVASAGALAALAQLIEVPLPQLSRHVVGAQGGGALTMPLPMVLVTRRLYLWVCVTLT